MSFNCCLTRKFRFSASHRLYISRLSEEENFKIFDRCSSPEGHGHDYLLEVKAKGKVDEITGMVVNHEHFRNAGENIIEQLNYVWIDRDLDYFKGRQSTVENIGVYLWQEFYRFLGDNLYGIKVWENKRSYFEYFEEN